MSINFILQQRKGPVRWNDTLSLSLLLFREGNYAIVNKYYYVFDNWPANDVMLALKIRMRHGKTFLWVRLWDGRR